MSDSGKQITIKQPRDVNAILNRFRNKVGDNLGPKPEDYREEFSASVPWMLSVGQAEAQRDDGESGRGYFRLYNRSTEEEIWVRGVAEDAEKFRDYDAIVHMILVESMYMEAPEHIEASEGGLIGGTQFARLVQDPDGSWRTMKPSETRDPEEFVWCRSSNGLFPDDKYLGQTVVLPNRDMKHVIGFEAVEGSDELVPITDEIIINGVTYPDICSSCPANKWRKGANGRSSRYCNPQFNYVVYIFPFKRGDGVEFEGGLVEIWAKNTTLQVSLRGVSARKNAYGALEDGRRLYGMSHFFEKRAKRPSYFLLEKEDVVESQIPYIVAFTESAEHEPLPVSEDFTFEDGMKSDMPFAVLATATFVSFPEGRPEHRNTFVPVFPVVMTTALNTMETKQMATHLQKAAAALDEDDFAEYVEALTEYWGLKPSHRSFRMRLPENSDELWANYNDAFATAFDDEDSGGSMVLNMPEKGKRRVGTGSKKKPKTDEESELDL